MTSLPEIEAAIKQLPEGEIRQLRGDEVWDQQIENVEKQVKLLVLFFTKLYAREEN